MWDPKKFSEEIWPALSEAQLGTPQSLKLAVSVWHMDVIPLPQGKIPTPINATRLSKGATVQFTITTRGSYSDSGWKTKQVDYEFHWIKGWFIFV